MSLEVWETLPETTMKPYHKPNCTGKILKSQKPELWRPSGKNGNRNGHLKHFFCHLP